MIASEPVKLVEITEPVEVVINDWLSVHTVALQLLPAVYAANANQGFCFSDFVDRAYALANAYVARRDREMLAEAKEAEAEAE